MHDLHDLPFLNAFLQIVRKSTGVFLLKTLKTKAKQNALYRCTKVRRFCLLFSGGMLFRLNFVGKKAA